MFRTPRQDIYQPLWDLQEISDMVELFWEQMPKWTDNGIFWRSQLDCHQIAPADMGSSFPQRASGLMLYDKSHLASSTN